MNQRLIDRIIKKSRSNYDKEGDIYQHFSYIIDRNKIIAEGRNDRKKTHTFSFRHGYTYFKIHSELAAIKNFPYHLPELKSCSLVNIRVNRKLEFINSRPCLPCMKLLDYFGINEIIYTNENGNFVSL